MNINHDEITKMERLSLNSSATELTMDDATYYYEDDNFEQDSEVDFYDVYHFGKMLGEGGYGKVYQCFHRNSLLDAQRESFAVKTVPMDKFDHDEIEILDDLMECPNVTRVIDLFRDEDEAYIVMEEMKGGDLLDRLGEKGCYGEEEAKALFKTLLETVLFCHSKGIAHCDIKPEQILLRQSNNDTDMQLADFGLAQRFMDADGNQYGFSDPVGTVEYMAPEILMQTEDDLKGYDQRCDIWSLGVVLYILLGGYHPFQTDNMEEMIEQISSGSFCFHKRYWNNISTEAKALIKNMLEVNPDERCSLEEALSSEWFSASA